MSEQYIAIFYPLKKKKRVHSKQMNASTSLLPFCFLYANCASSQASCCSRNFAVEILILITCSATLETIGCAIVAPHTPSGQNAEYSLKPFIFGSKVGPSPAKLHTSTLAHSIKIESGNLNHPTRTGDKLLIIRCIKID